VDGVNNGATTSVSEKVVTALLNNLLDTAMDKVMAKTVHGMEKNGNFVQKKEVESGEKNGGKEKSGKVKAPVTKTTTPAWVEDPKLPPGWKTCVTVAGKSALYYSPCGNLFTNWAQVEKFLGPALLKDSAVERATENKAVQQGNAEETPTEAKVLRQESCKNKRSPVETGKESIHGSSAPEPKSTKRKNLLSSLKKGLKPEEEASKLKTEEPSHLKNAEKRGGDKVDDKMRKSFSKLSGDLQLSDDAISLSDEELPVRKSAERKRKSSGEVLKSKSSKSKKQCAENHIEREGKNGASIKPTKAQEDVLLAAFRQWPVAFPELVDALVADTKLERDQVKQWFLQTRHDCLSLLWESLEVR